MTHALGGAAVVLEPRGHLSKALGVFRGIGPAQWPTR